MKERGGERQERDDPEQNERHGRTDEAVKRVSRVNVGIGDRRSRRGQHARDVRLGETHDPGLDLTAPGPFAGPDQSERHEAREKHPLRRAEPALLDRIANEEEAAERERDAAGPDRPLRAEALLETGFCLDGRRRRRGRVRDGFRHGADRLVRSGLFLGRGVRGRGEGCGRSLRRRFKIGPVGKPSLERVEPLLSPREPRAHAQRQHQACDGDDRNGEEGEDERWQHCSKSSARGSVQAQKWRSPLSREPPSSDENL